MEVGVRETADLGEVYPDMGEQFSNKHLLLLGQLKDTFSTIYEGSPVHTQTCNRSSTWSSTGWGGCWTSEENYSSVLDWKTG